MDGFTGYKTAATEAIDEVVTVMDPFHVVALAGDKLDLCRQRLQQETLGRRGRSGDPLFGIRRVVRTRAALLTQKQWFRLLDVIEDPAHLCLAVTWQSYQDIIDAYQHREPTEGKKLMTKLIDTLAARCSSRADRATPSGPDPAPTPRRRAGLLRPSRHLERPNRGDQMPTRHLIAYADVWIMPTVTTFTLVRDDRLLVVSA